MTDAADDLGPQLRLATLADIAGELERRYHAYVLICEEDARNDPTQSERSLSYGGGWSAAVGLAVHLYDVMRENSKRAARDRLDAKADDGESDGD